MVAKKTAKAAKKAKEPVVETPAVDQQTVDRLKGEIEALEAQLDAAEHPVPFTEPSN